MSRDIDNEKFIQVVISLSTTSSGLIKAKKNLKEYADELDWNLKIDKKGYLDDEGHRRYMITIEPPGEGMSAEEIKSKFDLISGFTYSIMRDLIYVDMLDQMPEFKTHFTIGPHPEKSNGDYLYISLGDVTTFTCELSKAISFEANHNNFFKNTLGLSLHDWYFDSIDTVKKTFCNKQELNNAENIIKIMERCGIEKVPYKKKKLQFKY